MSNQMYLAVYEKADDGSWGGYIPALPGLGVVGETLEEAQQLLQEGLRIHIEGLIEDGLPIPEPVREIEVSESAKRVQMIELPITISA